MVELRQKGLVCILLNEVCNPVVEAGVCDIGGDKLSFDPEVSINTYKQPVEPSENNVRVTL